MRFGSICTGGDLVGVGDRLAGLTPIWGIEIDPAVAAVAELNDRRMRVYAVDAVEVDWALLPRVDVLHASPPCTRYSVGNSTATESPIDHAVAQATCRAIYTHRPQIFTLENVAQYAKSESLKYIKHMLADLEYHITEHIVNAADYGVPQARKRLILIAHAGGMLQAERPLPPKQAWRGWHGAVADLIPQFAPDQFAAWQTRLLEKKGITTSGNTFMIDGMGHRRVTDVTVRYAHEPSVTITSSVGKHPMRIWVPRYGVKRMVPRGLARLQTLPDWYQLPSNGRFAGHIIGNGVPSELYRQVITSQLP